MSSSILIVGHPYPKEVEFGADVVSSVGEGKTTLQEKPYAVLVIPDYDDPSQGDAFDCLKVAKETNPDIQTILVTKTTDPKTLKLAINKIGLFKIIPDFSQLPLQNAVREALEEYELIKQNQAFLTLTKEQNLRLQHLSGLLEEKVKAREEFLSKAREKLVEVTKRTESLNQALVAVQKSVTRSEIESLVNQALQNALNLTWTKILFENETFGDVVPQNISNNVTIFSSPLLRKKELLGHIYFAREQNKPFSPDEDDFLLQVGDAVGLAIDRITTLDATEALKKEWDSTFDSVTAPVSLVDEDFNLVRANRAFSDKTQSPLDSLQGQKCYQALFNLKQPCKNCTLGKSFNLGEMKTKDGDHVNFTVSSHLVPIESGSKTYAMLYRDVSEEHRIQRQILESSKMAEIGTIGSSIAHEINNPLGGMIAFLQILRSELDPDDKLKKDIVDMEEAALRCKKIVENLLAFTRQSAPSEIKPTRFKDLLTLVINIIELQTRALGIEISQDIQDPNVHVLVNTNQVVQVIVNVMQNSCDAIVERLKTRRKPAPKIDLKTSKGPDDQLVIEITDNGTGINSADLPRVFTPFFTTKDKETYPGLGLSVSYQIIKEHGGQMEISSVSGQSTTVSVSIPTTKKT